MRWWDKKYFLLSLWYWNKNAGDWNLEKKYINYMYICIFLFKEYFSSFLKLRTTSYSLVNLHFFNRLSDKSLQFFWFDTAFYTHNWCRLLTKLDFSMAFETVPLISDRSQQFPSLYPYFTLSQDILAAVPHLSWFPCSLQVLFLVEAPCSLLGWTPEPQLLTTQDMESAMKAESS